MREEPSLLELFRTVTSSSEAQGRELEYLVAQKKNRNVLIIRPKSLLLGKRLVRANSLQEIEEDGDDGSIDQVGKHGTDDGDDEEGLDGIVVLVAYGTHVGHGIRSGAKTETTNSCAEDGGIVVAT